MLFHIFSQIFNQMQNQIIVKLEHRICTPLHHVHADMIVTVQALITLVAFNQTMQAIKRFDLFTSLSDFTMKQNRDSHCTSR